MTQTDTGEVSRSPEGTPTVGDASLGERPFPELAGVRHSYQAAGDVTLHVAEAGDGPPLVLLHGWPQHWYEWRELIGPLSRDHRVVCPDLRGFGWSDAPRRGYDRETMARDILALLEQMGIDRFGVVGHDWGGWLGFLMAIFHSERVERLLALNIAHPFTPPSFKGALSQWRFAYQLVLATPGLGPWTIHRAARRGRGLLLRWSGASRAWGEEETRLFLSQFEDADRVRASVQLYREFQATDMRRVLGGRYRRMGLRTPTLLLYGTRDHIIRPVHVSNYERYARGMEVEFVENCGHFIVDERPELVLDRARRFFA